MLSWPSESLRPRILSIVLHVYPDLRNSVTTVEVVILTMTDTKEQSMLWNNINKAYPSQVLHALPVDDMTDLLDNQIIRQESNK